MAHACNVRRAFVEANRRFVHERTDGAIGYVHVPNMGAPGYSEFRRSYSAESARDHLIVDVRYNEGGFSSTLLLDVLSRRRMAWTLSPWRNPAPFPRQAPGGIVVICNEHTGSDGDMFVQAVRELGLAPVVGVRTWGGVIGISPREPLADGTVVTQPENAHWFASVGYDVEGHGAEPTHVVQISPAEVDAGHDPQLATAIQLARSLAAPPQPPRAPH
jgi:tricorn protease